MTSLEKCRSAGMPPLLENRLLSTETDWDRLWALVTKMQVTHNMTLQTAWQVVSELLHAVFGTSDDPEDGMLLG